MSNRGVLVVDLQNEYWPSGNFSLHGIEAAAANAARVMDHARAKADLVVNIRHEMPGGPIFVPGSAGAEINDAVRPCDRRAGHHQELPELLPRYPVERSAQGKRR